LPRQQIGPLGNSPFAHIAKLSGSSYEPELSLFAFVCRERPVAETIDLLTGHLSCFSRSSASGYSALLTFHRHHFLLRFDGRARSTACTYRQGRGGPSRFNAPRGALVLILDRLYSRRASNLAPSNTPHSSCRRWHARARARVRLRDFRRLEALRDRVAPTVEALARRFDPRA
jgi:hypothetical protein